MIKSFVFALVALLGACTTVDLPTDHEPFEIAELDSIAIDQPDGPISEVPPAMVLETAWT